MNVNFTLVVEKHRIKPTPELVVINTVPVVCHVTAKRATVLSGTYKGRVFDLSTGNEVVRKDLRLFRRYSLSILPQKVGNL